MQDKVDEARAYRVEGSLEDSVAASFRGDSYVVKLRTVTVGVLCIETNPTSTAGFWLVTELVHLGPGFCLPLRSIGELVLEERYREPAGAQGCTEACMPYSPQCSD